MTICFDTNVLAYAIDATTGHRHAQALEIVRAVSSHREAVLILQTAGEFYSVATRKLQTTPADARAFLARLRAVLPVHGAAEPDLDRAMAAAEHHRISFWDALLWATADRIGIQYLLTENVSGRPHAWRRHLRRSVQRRERAAAGRDPARAMSARASLSRRRAATRPADERS